MLTEDDTWLLLKPGDLVEPTHYAIFYKEDGPCLNEFLRQENLGKCVGLFLGEGKYEKHHTVSHSALQVATWTMLRVLVGEEIWLFFIDEKREAEEEVRYKSWSLKKCKRNVG